MWEQIRSNRSRSLMLVAVMAALLLVLGYVIGEAVQPGAGILGFGVALAIWLVMSLVAYYQGGHILLAMSGAHEINHDDHPQLFNVVEEMKIAAALPKMPKVYIINDPSLNAFATGRDPEHAAVAVTAGLLGRLNRDELQGVIAHEMSHVLNRDVLLMSMTGVMLGAIVTLSDIFLRGMYYGGGSRRRYSSSSRNSKAGGAQAIILAVAIALAILSPILAQVIYYAISRRREYLADANAAVLTRYPEGLASALERIAQDPNVIENVSRATAPMYIANPLRKPGQAATGWSSTHPPIEERVRILRAMSGGASYREYQSAWTQVSGKRAGHMPASALQTPAAGPLRQASAQTGRPVGGMNGISGAPAMDAMDAKAQWRDAGDLVRRVNGFSFLPCACGVQIKLPPNFRRSQVVCPKCRRTLQVPQAQTAMMAAGMIAAAGAMRGDLGEAEAPAAESALVATAVPDEQPLEVTRTAPGWMTFKCRCGQPHNVSPAAGEHTIRCRSCGRSIFFHGIPKSR